MKNTYHGSFFLIIISFIFIAACSSKPKPSDQELLDWFSSKERNFEALIKDVSKYRKLFLRTKNSLNPKLAEKLGISKELVLEYKQRLDALGLALVLSIRGDPQPLWLVVWDYRPAPPGGAFKGFAYTEHPLKPLVDDLDVYWKNHDYKNKGGDFTVYRHIKGNWYLFASKGD